MKIFLIKILRTIILYINTFQKTLESFFPWWDDINYHREVVLFACGLMSDPTHLVDHVYQKWINAYLEGITKGDYDEYDEYGEYRHKYDIDLLKDHVYQKWVDKYLDEIKHKKFDMNTDLLKALYAESNVQLSGSALHNNNINFYNHTDDSSDTTHVYTPSKMYVFLNMKTYAFCEFKNREEEANIPECAMMIRLPDATVTNSLLMACQRISKYQPLLDLHMFKVSLKYQSESDGFHLSENAHSLLLKSCTLTSQPLNHLMHKLSECNKIRKIDLMKTNLWGISSLTLSNKTSLTHLDLGETNMSAELCKSICQQLTDITHLEYLNLSDNYLSQVSLFALNNKRNLKYLNLKNTHMSSTLYYTICEQLTDLEYLEEFVVSTGNLCYRICYKHKHLLTCSLSHTHLPPHICRRVFHQINRFSDLCSIQITNSPLTGCVSSFLPDHHKGLPRLNDLKLDCTALKKDDLQHLSDITHRNKLPNLQELDLSHNILAGCLSSFLSDHHPGLPELKKLNLCNTELNKEDLKHLSHITQSNKLPKIKTLILSENTLTGCFCRFLPNPHPGLPELWSLHLTSTSLNKEDLQHLFSIIQFNKLPKLWSLNLSGNILTGSLSSFLQDPHPGLPELQWLLLQGTSLNREDLQHLFSIIHSNKLPKLYKLGLSRYTLTGVLSSFLPDPHPGLPELWFLNLQNTTLNKKDLQHLFSIIQFNKLPKLWSLNLSGNILTGSLSSFLPDPHPGLSRLTFLYLEDMALNKEDLKHLLSIAHKLLKLYKLDLSGYTLTGCLSSFLPDPHPGLPKLRKLDLQSTALNKKDLQHLFSIIQFNKLPKL